GPGLRRGLLDRVLRRAGVRRGRERAAAPGPHRPLLPAMRSGLTPRAILLSLGLVVLVCQWVAVSEIRTTTTEITCTALPIGVVFVLFCLCLLNLALGRWWPRHAFSGSELAVV